LIVSYLIKHDVSAEQSEADQHGFISAFPSPFSEIIYISYLLSASEKAILRVFDLEGREVALIRQGDESAGLHHANWDTRNFRPGIYFLRLDTAEDTFTRKVVILDRAA
jgi:endoglucanase